MNKKLIIKLSEKVGASTSRIGVVCKSCKTIIFSRANHDFRYCPCGEIAVDGGQQYLRFLFKNVIPDRVILSLSGVTESDLIKDWASGKDDFGIIFQNRINDMQVFAMSSNGNDVLGVNATQPGKYDLTKPQILVKPVNMKTMLFSTAVILAVGAVRKELTNGFSAYDITNKLRKWVNNKELAFSDATEEDVDGVRTYRVSPDKVKQVFLDLYENGVITNIDKKYSSKGYFLYVDKVQAVATASPSFNSPATITNPPAVNTQTVKPTKTVINSDVVSKLKTYISNINKGEFRTIKQIQSRLKGTSVSCEEIANKLANLGYIVEGRNKSVSRWYVKQY